MNNESGHTGDQDRLFSMGDVETIPLVEYVDWLCFTRGPYIQLPPIQRGDVWKVAQVERLWDLVLRGFPIGSFLLAPFKVGAPSRGLQSTKMKGADRNGWFLLDGQQRSRSLMLTHLSQKPTARLWIDMSPQADSMFDRAFLFRLCTAHHPWGMEHDPDRKIEEAALRTARQELEGEPTKGTSLLYDYGRSLQDTWPVRSTLPVPFADLVEHVRQHRDNGTIEWDDLLPKDKRSNLKARQDNYAKSILEASSKMLQRNVVLLKLDPAIDPMLSWQDSEKANVPDAMETLFERINSGGTRLEGDEMMFSLLKASWPDAYTLVQAIVDHEKVGFLLKPTAIVLSAARLAYPDNKGDSDVARPKVRQFRRWIAEKGEDGRSNGQFLNEMKRCIGSSNRSVESRFVSIVLAFLEAAQYRSDHDIGFPRSLLQCINPLAIDVVFRWIDIRLDSHDFKRTLDDSRLPIVRFLVHSLIAWTHPEKASQSAFNVVSSDGNDRFPCRDIYKHLIKKEEGKPVAWEMPSLKAMEDRILSSPNKKGLHTYEELFSGESYGKFVERFWNQKVMLLWFQRAHLESLFPGYDPFRMRSDAPFDYDHILASRHLGTQGKSLDLGNVIDKEEEDRFRKHRDLYRNSIGNHRIWPGWANRQDQDLAPDKKLRLDHEGDLASDDSLRKFGFNNSSEICAASTISINEEHLNLWKSASGPPLDWKKAERRDGFQRAVEQRIIWLYESLYNTLQFEHWISGE